MGAVAVTRLVKGLMYVMFGATPVALGISILGNVSLVYIALGTPLVGDGRFVVVNVLVVFCCLLSPAGNGPTPCSVLTLKEIFEFVSRSQREDDFIERKNTHWAVWLRAENWWGISTAQQRTQRHCANLHGLTTSMEAPKWGTQCSNAHESITTIIIFIISGPQ